MTDGLTITGGWQLINRSVAIVIAGLDCGNFIVGSDGTVFVPFGSDPDGLFTPSYLNSVSDPRSTNPALVTFNITVGADTITVYVPLLIGYPYTSQGRLLRPISEQEVKTPQGPALGKKRRTHRVGALLHSAQGISFTCDNNTLDPANFTDPGGNTLTKDTLFSGVYRKEIDDNWSFDSMLAWQITRPYPCTIVALSGFIETNET